VQNTVVYETSQQLMEKLAVEALQVAMVSDLPFCFRLYIYIYIKESIFLHCYCSRE
jgi:hypothetical protein